MSENIRKIFLILVLAAGCGYLLFRLYLKDSFSWGYYKIRNSTSCAISKEYSDLKDFNTVEVSMSEIMLGQPIVLHQDDKRIIKYIWDNELIHKPSNGTYKLTNLKKNPSDGQSQYIIDVLKNMTNGFFVECGALDGEETSNTLFMEKYLNWTGLLVEADPKTFFLLKNKNRKAWISNTCLAIKPYPHTAAFKQNWALGKINPNRKNNEADIADHIKIQCVPLFSLLTALNKTIVDYYSLDVEGMELQVLKTIPFDKVFIRTLSVEYKHTIEGKGAVWEFMTSKGYKVYKEVSINRIPHDFLFVHKNVILPNN